ncbi:uncharacterized protein LOC116296979 [Actinia tenebrosa]|uniref:Uncharacterized protein LOC116296979 n=1 Tax=Actinia tenebrosa TaxID=6105 RepID=A0A6P8I8I6_ACTTE|nr:uncharacterized protein LOC116296979 [Actinia tenebrosa]
MSSGEEMLLDVEITSSNPSSCAPYALIITNTVLVSVVCLRPEFYKIKTAVLAILFGSDSIAFFIGVMNSMDYLTREDHLERQNKGNQTCLIYRLQANVIALLFNAALVIVVNQRTKKLKSPEKVPVTLSNVLCVLFNGIAWYIPNEINRQFHFSMYITVQGDWIQSEIWGLDLIFVLYFYRGIFIGLSFISDYLNAKNEEDDERELRYISYL